MKKSITLLAIVFIFGCMPENETIQESSNSIEDIFQHEALQNETQVFTLSNDKDTLLEGKAGIKVFIEKNAFQDAAGNLVEGDVEIELKEVVSISDMLKENMSTVTKDGILETRGMVKIDVFANGEALTLADGKQLKLFFPKPSEENEDVGLFYGVENEEGVLEWEAAEGENLVEEETEAVNEIVKDIVIRYPDLEGLEEDQVYFKNDPEAFDLLDQNLSFSKQEMELLVNSTIRIHWILFDDGDLDIIQVDGAISERQQQSIVDKLSQIPFIPPFIREADAADIQGMIDIYFRYSSAPAATAIQGIEYSDYYVLNTPQIGWINCDFFLQFNVPKIDMDILKPNDKTSMKIVFNNYKTVIMPYGDKVKFYCYQVPQGEPIKIVAYEKTKDGLAMSITETYVKSRIEKLNPFEATDEESILKELEKMDGNLLSLQ